MNWNCRTSVRNSNLTKPAEHHNKAIILLWLIDTDIKVSASTSLSTDTAQNVAELFWNFCYVGVLINNFEILYTYTFIGFEVRIKDVKRMIVQKWFGNYVESNGRGLI